MVEIVKGSSPLKSIQKSVIPHRETPSDFMKIYVKRSPLLDNNGFVLPMKEQMTDFKKAISELKLSIFFTSMVNPYVVELFVEKKKHQEIMDILNKHDVNIIKSFDSTLIKSTDPSKIVAIKSSISKRIAFICLKTRSNKDFQKYVRQGFDQDILDEVDKWISHFQELHTTHRS
jgi:hypothetical protein